MSDSTTPPRPAKSWYHYYHQTPLYLRILIALIFGVIVGVVFQENAIWLKVFSQIILRLLGALAPPLIFIAVIHVLMTSHIPGKKAGRLFFLLTLNTVVAILIGLTVANLIQPGKWNSAAAAVAASEAEQGDPTEIAKKATTPAELLVNNIPRSVIGPFGDQANVIGVIILAVAFGISLRRSKDLALARSIVEVVYEALVAVLHWIIDVVPLGVFAIVASVIGEEGFKPLINLGGFIITVLVALLLQSVWYLTRIKLFSWASPLYVLRGMRDALFMAFSTDSSTATMPVTYACLKDKVGVREQSASLGGLVGANFNNDGTALYEATAALFVAQLVGKDLSTYEQLIVVLTSIIASVGAAGIPEAGLVTMTVVFTAVGLPLEKIGMLLAVDWFLDRCRTTINVLGDVNVSLMLDGKTRQTAEELAGHEHTHILPHEFKDDAP